MRQRTIVLMAAAAALVMSGAGPLGDRVAGQTPAVAPAAGRQGGRAGAPDGARGRGAGRGGGGRGLDAPGADFLKRPPVVRLDPAVEQQMFLLPPGYHIEPVLTDPEIEDPVAVTFDGNGRMYVLEMRSYMQDAAGTNAMEPVSRISRHEDTDGDGVYDKHTVFVDHLVLPRIAFPLEDGALLVLETNNRDLYKYTDTNGDGVADTKTVFYPNFGRVTNMEWQPGGMAWPLDNWLYSTYNPYRLRIGDNGQVIREETDPNGGQWGLAQDNYGKLWFVDGGGETGPVNIQAPIVYGAFNAKDNFEPDFQVPWPAPGGIADPQGGMGRVRLPDGTLNHFTAAAGPEIYRGHRLPSDLVGDLLFEEPVGRIVRRAKIVVTEGMTQLQNAYPKSEFLRSTDPLFRPVNIANAPDGTLYLVDMYTGIIQDSQFVGDYLKAKDQQYELGKQHNWGRIWRITYDGMAPDHTQPRMYDETPAQLVAHLTHPSGWWRDTAQKLLVLKQDRSVVPALQQMARTSGDQLARIHALWTLEGLHALDAPLARELMKSPDAALRIQAIRASETLYKAGDKSFADDYRAMLKDADVNVAIQAMLTLNLQKVPGAEDLIRATAKASNVRGIREMGELLFQPGASQGQRPSLADTAVFGYNLSTEERRGITRGEGTYRELCFSCHGTDGKGTPMGGSPGETLAPPLAGSSRVTGHREYIIKVLLFGMTGTLDGNDYNGGVMAPMGANTDEWIADVANYVRNSFGNSGMLITPADVAAVRTRVSRQTPWAPAEVLASIPTPLTNEKAWQLTASHNAAAAPGAVDGSGGVRWDTGVTQQPGMWFQVELPEVTSLREVQFDVAAPFTFGRGGRGGFPRNPLPAGPPVATSLQVSTDGRTWSAPVAHAPGAATTILAFAPVRAKFIRITQTGTPANTAMWAIQRLRIYEGR